MEETPDGLARALRLAQEHYRNPGERPTMSDIQPLIADSDKVAEMPADVRQLMSAVSSLPAQYREKLEPALMRVAASTKRRRRILSLVQDALSQLRLDMKYLMFDLEATRRERDSYREQLEEHY